MAVAYSAQYEDQFIDVPRTPVLGSLAFGTMHFQYFSFTNPASGGLSGIGDLIYLVKVPPTCDIIMPLSLFKFSAWDTNTTIDIGWLAYTEPDGDAVAADDNGLLDGLDVDAAGWWTANTTMTSTSTMAHNAGIVQVKNIRSRHPVTLTAVFRDAAPTASDTLEGYFVIATL